jgi:hypothetical protein
MPCESICSVKSNGTHTSFLLPSLRQRQLEQRLNRLERDNAMQAQKLNARGPTPAKFTRPEGDIRGPAAIIAEKSPKVPVQGGR